MEGGVAGCEWKTEQTLMTFNRTFGPLVRPPTRGRARFAGSTFPVTLVC